VPGFFLPKVISLRNNSISAFFPAYNDAGSIGTIVRKVAQILPSVADDYEVVVVNDGSQDGTAALLDGLAREYPFLKVIHHASNRGYGAALITGFSKCSKDLIFYTDGDGQYDVEELPLLLNALTEEIDIVNGYKISRSDPLHRVVLGKAYQRLMRLLFWLNVRDVDCDFRLFRRNLFDRVELTCDSGVICVEMIKKFQANGFRMAEVPVHHYSRASGSSQFFSPRHLGRVFVQLFSAWWNLIVLRKLSRPAAPANPARVGGPGYRLKNGEPQP
jgi:glycosyltransferase involved in cell wall biosynthesis